MPIVSVDTFINTKLHYLIIGGGTSGLVVAARLSENPNVVVGVLEAGEHHVGVPAIDIPGMMTKIISNPQFDWNLVSVPQPRANNREIKQPRGKGLGGSSFLNFMNLFRPSKEEYDALEQLGNPGWNWEELLKYTKKSESTVYPKLSPEEAERYAVSPDHEYHGTNGPIKKSYPLYWAPANIPFLDTLEELGVPRNSESSKGRPIGCVTSWASINPATARRSYTANEYYEPNANRPNLLVLTGAQVTKVLLEPGHGGLQKATGAEFVKDGVIQKVVDVTRDVIVSCGTFQTPHILELSGIGNPTLLGQFGIDAKVDLPGVGENLQDHVLTPSVGRMTDDFETLDALTDPVYLEKHQTLYQSQKGLLSSVGAQSFAFMPLQAFATDAQVETWRENANAQIIIDSNAATIPSLKKSLNKQYEVQKKLFGDKNQVQGEIILVGGHFPLANASPIPGKRYSTVNSALMQPLSRGSVHVASRDPLVPPAINPNYFGNPVDLDIITHMLLFTLKVYTTGSFAKYTEEVTVPAKEVVEEAFEGKLEKLKDYVRETCRTVFHPVGTAAMLPREDGGVVDSKLKVYGTANLRVADMSIIPLELACHTQSTALAIGEKAADIIKAESRD